MKKHSIFLLLAIVANNALSIGNPFRSKQADSCPIPQMVDIEELNMVGPHPMELDDILKSLKNRVDTGLNRMLIYGPPGTGKSKYAEEIAKIANCNFIIINGSNFTDGHSGIERLSNVFAQAQFGGPLIPNFDPSRPTVISIEEAHALSNKFQESTNNIAITLWLELDKIKNNKNIFVFLSTNHKELIHTQILSMMGPNKIETKLPDKATRQKLFKFYLASFPELEGHFEKFVKASDKGAHRDIENACKAAIRHSHNTNQILSPAIVIAELAKAIKSQTIMENINELSKNHPDLGKAIIATVGLTSAIIGIFTKTPGGGTSSSGTSGSSAQS